MNSSFLKRIETERGRFWAWEEILTKIPIILQGRDYGVGWRRKKLGQNGGINETQKANGAKCDKHPSPKLILYHLCKTRLKKDTKIKKRNFHLIESKNTKKKINYIIFQENERRRLCTVPRNAGFTPFPSPKPSRSLPLPNSVLYFKKNKK